MTSPETPRGPYAHSLPDGYPRSAWEPLLGHGVAVGNLAARLAEPFGFAEAARIAGLLHDIGKASPEFQAYIRGERARGGDHSTVGAREALAGLPAPLGRMLAHIIAGHHAGLADGESLQSRLDPKQHPVPAYPGWQAHTGPLPGRLALSPTRRFSPGPEAGFTEAFLIRMLFSCLVDADSLATGRYYAEVEGRGTDADPYTPTETLRDRLRTHMAAMRGREGPVNALRRDILDHAVARAGDAPGLFTMTVPTGGGKTLASLSFALEHAARHGLRRVVFVIPFTSIIEQSAAVFRAALAAEPGRPNRDDVLEHHASFDWEALRRPDDEGRGPEPLDHLRRAAENWDAPVVVTTAVQFFESLFSNRRSRCRKLHNLARSVVVLDEAQTLPLPLLRPCLAALDELSRNYGASVVLCTATQPALRKQDGFENGLDVPEARELAPDPPGLYAKLKRVRVERLPEPVGDEVIAARFAEQPRMLCVVNSRRHAGELFGRIRGLPGAVHLTTLMCPRHRRRVLDEARARLGDPEGAPVRIVSTSLIEAGVDIDLPEVWRAAAGLDSVAQAAGRANREGRLASGRVVVFEPLEGGAPAALEQAWAAGRGVLRRHAEDPLALDAVRDYFQELYWQRGVEELDAPRLDGARWPILRAIAERAPGRGERDPLLLFPFESIARAFRMIEDAMEPVIVPWRSGPDDDEAERLLARIAAMGKPLRNDLRQLQQYTVSIPRKARETWLAQGVLRPVHPALGEALLRFEDLGLYDAATGVRLNDPTYRTAADNLM